LPFFLAYGVWRCFEPAAQRSTKLILTGLASRSGLPVASRGNARGLARGEADFFIEA